MNEATSLTQERNFAEDLTEMMFCINEDGKITGPIPKANMGDFASSMAAMADGLWRALDRADLQNARAIYSRACQDGPIRVITAKRYAQYVYNKMPADGAARFWLVYFLTGRTLDCTDCAPEFRCGNAISWAEDFGPQP